MMAQNALSFVIRAAHEDDLSACIALDHSSVSDYVWQVEVDQTQGRISFTFHTARLPRSVTLGYPKGTQNLVDSWQRYDCFLVAASEERIYGYLTMRLDHVPGVGWINDLVVDHPWRRRGVGSALLRQTRQWASNHLLRRITIETQTKNYPAIAFCEHHGLAFCGFNDRHYPNQDIAVFFSQAVR